MAKKKKFSREITKSLAIMEKLSGCLQEFAHMPLKKGLGSIEDEDDLTKLVNETTETAFSLINKIHDLRKKIETAKDKKLNTRFAAKRVIDKFLSI